VANSVLSVLLLRSTTDVHQREKEESHPPVRHLEAGMRLVSSERLVPSRGTSAAREVIQGREYVDAARNCLELALELYRGSEGQAAEPSVPALEQVLGQLTEAEAVLWEMSQ